MRGLRRGKHHEVVDATMGADVWPGDTVEVFYGGSGSIIYVATAKTEPYNQRNARWGCNLLPLPSTRKNEACAA